MITSPLSQAMHPEFNTSVEGDIDEPHQRFKFPDGFEEESSVSERLQLTERDLDGDKELWLIKVPSNFDCGTDKKLKLDLDGITQVTNNDRQYRITARKLKGSSQNYTAALLSSEKGCLSLAPPFAGHVTVTEIPTLPEVTIPPSPPSPKVTLPAGMRQRYQPYGASPGNTRKRRMEISDADVTDSSSPNKKKKKKKRSHDAAKMKDDADESYQVGEGDTFVEDEENMEQEEESYEMTVQSSKKKHQKEKDIVESIDETVKKKKKKMKKEKR